MSLQARLPVLHDNPKAVQRAREDAQVTQWNRQVAAAWQAFKRAGGGR